MARKPSVNSDAINIVKQKFSERLKSLRSGGIGQNDCIPLSQEELAELLGVGEKTIGKWEQCSGLPSAENLYSISKFYGVSIDWLLGLQDNWLLTEDAKVSAATTGLSNKAISSIIRLKNNHKVVFDLDGKEITEGMLDLWALDDLLCLGSISRYLSSGYLLRSELNEIRDAFSNGQDESDLQDKLEFALFSFTERMKELADDLYSYRSLMDDLREFHIRRIYRAAAEEHRISQASKRGSDHGQETH